MTDREKLEKARGLVGEVQDNLSSYRNGNAWADADCAMDYISDVIRALPKPKRFEVRGGEHPENGGVVSLVDTEPPSFAPAGEFELQIFRPALGNPLAQEYCDLLNRGHEANDV